MNADVFKKKGICCNIFIKYPRYNKSINLSVFRILLPSKTKRLLKSPMVNLMDRALMPLKSLEYEARSAVRKYTISLHDYFSLYFCPVRNIAVLHSNLENIKYKFNNAVDEFIEQYPANVETAKALWQAFVEKQTNLPEDIKKELFEAGVKTLTPYPPPKQFFKFDFISAEFSSAATPSLVDVDAGKIEITQQALQKIQEETQQKFKEIAESITKTCEDELYKRIYDMLTNMHDIIETGKPINRKTLVKFNDFVTLTENLNFVENADINQILETLRKTVFPQGVSNPDLDIYSISDVSRVEQIKSIISQMLTSVANKVVMESVQDDSDLYSHSLSKNAEIATPMPDGSADLSHLL